MSNPLRLVPIGVITNPNSGKNRARGRRRYELERAIGRQGIVVETRELSELRGAVETLLDAGCRYWVCDGGDGTLHWLLSVGHRIARERGNGHGPIPLPKIVPANGGSIDFVAHKAGIKGDAAAAVEALRRCLERGEEPPTVSLDTLRIRGRSKDDDEFDQIGFAAALGGVAQRFFDKLYEGKRPVRASSIVQVLTKATAGVVAGTAPRPLNGFLAPGLRDYADHIFEPTRAKVAVNGKELGFRSFSSLQVGSIDITLGGVIRSFRHASEAGVLHAQAVQTSRLGVVANLPNILMGTRIWGRDVYDGPIESLTAEALDGQTLDPIIDGEQFRGLANLEVSRGPRLEVAAVCTA